MQGSVRPSGIPNHLHILGTRKSGSQRPTPNNSRSLRHRGCFSFQSWCKPPPPSASKRTSPLSLLSQSNPTPERWTCMPTSTKSQSVITWEADLHLIEGDLNSLDLLFVFHQGTLWLHTLTRRNRRAPGSRSGCGGRRRSAARRPAAPTWRP